MVVIKKPLGYVDAPVKIEEKKDRVTAEKELACFMDNFNLLMENADLIMTTKEYANVRIDDIYCGLLYVSRHRPMTLGELLYYCKNDIFTDADSCCKKLYPINIVGSALSGCTWVNVFCPDCKKSKKVTMSGAGNLLKYIENAKIPYEPSRINIEELVRVLKKQGCH